MSWKYIKFLWELNNFYIFKFHQVQFSRLLLRYFRLGIIPILKDPMHFCAKIFIVSIFNQIQGKTPFSCLLRGIYVDKQGREWLTKFSTFLSCKRKNLEQEYSKLYRSTILFWVFVFSREINERNISIVFYPTLCRYPDVILILFS